MRYEHTPRPTIEDHYHIRELIEAQEKRAADRSYYRDRDKRYADRNDTIKSAQSFCLSAFYCNKCDKDFFAEAMKEVEVDWTNKTQYIAFYKTKHWCGAWCQRLITDKQKDQYWFRSKAVKADQGKHYGDTIQPHETGFQLLYGRKNQQRGINL